MKASVKLPVLPEVSIRSVCRRLVCVASVYLAMAPANGNIVMRFGQTVRRIRLKQGLSQERYAELAEVHRNYVGLIERGERSPTLSNLVRLANGLGISLSELLRRAQL
ncbi:MAG: hypothetical protein RJB38_2146 [Pseudomonadota bacterium]